MPNANAFSESGYEYDLNGNIMGMTRKGKNGSNLDILTYDYGMGNKQSNQLVTSQSRFEDGGFHPLG